MPQLKDLHADAVPAAIAKAERYRFLADAGASESICRDILKVDPQNQVIKKIQELTKKDFPETKIRIAENGLITYLVP